jgi:hypothetical protein
MRFRQNALLLDAAERAKAGRIPVFLPSPPIGEQQNQSWQ